MALTHCPYCGHVVSTTAERCPSCGAPVAPEVSKPVETPPAFAENKPHPSPQPAQNDEPDFDIEESHTGRNIIIIVVALLLVGAGIFLYRQQTGSNDYKSVMEDMDTTAVDTLVADSVMMDNAMAEDTCAAEPEETLEASLHVRGGYGTPRQLLATYQYGGLQRDYYWTGPGNGDSECQLSIYDENGKCLKKHNLAGTKYGFFGIDGDWRGDEKKIVTKLYNHHVYFVGIGGGSGGEYYTVFYLTPLEGNGIHEIGTGEGENGYEFLESSVRLQHVTITNEETAETKFDYEYEKTWETIPLQ